MVPVELARGLIVSSKGEVDVGYVLAEARDEVGQIFRSFEESLLSLFARFAVFDLDRERFFTLLHDAHSVCEISGFPDGSSEASDPSRQTTRQSAKVNSQGPEGFEIALNLIVLVDENDPVRLDVGPPLIEPSGRILLVPPAVLFNGLL